MKEKRSPEWIIWLVHVICYGLLLGVGYTMYRITGPKYIASGHGVSMQFSRLLQILHIMSGLLIAGLLVSFIALVFAGRQELAGIDLWYTEFVVLGLILACMVVYWGAVQISYGYLARSSLDVLTGAALCSLMYFPILFGVLSLIRRIRHHCLWEGFLCVRAYQGVVDSYERRNDHLKSGARDLYIFLFLPCDAVLAFAAGASAAGGRKITAIILGIIWLSVNAMFMIKVSQRGRQMKEIFGRIVSLASGDVGTKLDTSSMHGDIRRMAETVNALDRSLEKAVSERTGSERMKADLIANVSHDLRTPLTSIINYVDLLKREQIPDPRVQEYLSVLENKSMRLKTMAEALMEASRVSSGNLKITWERIDMVQMLRQVYGEFQERMEEKGLIPLVRLIDPPAVILADGQILWRVLDNLFTNVCKYGRPGTQVLIELQETTRSLVYTMKNVSDAPLRYSSDELMERFTRGEDSRTTEGSGLGLSIARSMTEQLHGKFELYSDEEMFRVRLIFPLAEPETGAQDMD